MTLPCKLNTQLTTALASLPLLFSAAGAQYSSGSGQYSAIRRRSIFEAFLTEIASRGFVVVASGEPNALLTRTTIAGLLTQTRDWARSTGAWRLSRQGQSTAATGGRDAGLTRLQCAVQICAVASLAASTASLHHPNLPLRPAECGPDGAGDRERTGVCEGETLQAQVTVNEQRLAKEEAEVVREGLTLWTDGSRTEDGACGYAVVWKKIGGAWKGQRVHLGSSQEAYDAECAAIVRALRIGRDFRKQQRISKITIFTDAQAAIRRMQTLEVGPGQIFALQARCILAEIDCPMEIRWCPAHEGITGNEKADEWAKVAADQPHEHGVEWLTNDNRPRRMPHTSLAHLSRQVEEKKWEEAKDWAYSRIRIRVTM